MQRLGFSLAVASLGLLGAVVGCSLITGLGDRPSYAIDGGASDAGAESAPLADASPDGTDGAGGRDACVDDASCAGHCGVLKDKCGVIVSCGGCPGGQTCGGGAGVTDGGAPNVCGGGQACMPLCSLGPTLIKGCGESDGCNNICTYGSCDDAGPGLACAAGVCTCGPDSCAGCCSNGVCNSGVGGPGGCGTGGVACTPTPQLECDAGLCGGYGQPCCSGKSPCQSPLLCGGGGNGDAGTCICVPNCVSAKCGDPDGCGGICQGAGNACPEGERCINGGVCTCDPVSCGSGCCRGSECLLPGAEEEAGVCGTGGVACGKPPCSTLPCGLQGASCCSGTACIAPLGCDAGHCSPCVGSCVGKLCGEDDGCGNACDPDGPDGGGAIHCPTGQHCRVPFGADSGGPMCACDSTSCREGCCIGSSCVNGNDGNPALCGLNGAQCIACAPGQLCSGGTCMTPGDP